MRVMEVPQKLKKQDQVKPLEWQWVTIRQSFALSLT